MDSNMGQSNIINTVLELDVGRIKRRLVEIIPGFLSWSALIALTASVFVVPFWVAIFIIIYDVYVLIRAVYMSVHLVHAYKRLRKMEDIDWLTRCKKINAGVDAYLADAKELYRKKKDWKNKQLLRSLEEVKQSGVEIFPWNRVHHVVVLPTYDESLTVLRYSLNSLIRSNFPKKQLHVVVGFEERAGEPAKERAQALMQEFGDGFATFITTMHPADIPGEKKVKSANATWAIQQMEKKLAEKGIEKEQVLVSNFDSDTVVDDSYFGHLTFNFIVNPKRYRVSYQPLPMYHNNVWDAPSFSRVIATGSTFWQMIESTRPERLVTFSSHSMTLKALVDVGYWQTDIVSEDSRIFWQCLIHYNGDYKTEPLYTSVSMDAALADNWWHTLVNQYKQKRRWAWGIENWPYLFFGFVGNKAMPFKTKFVYMVRTLEGHFSWATTPIIVAGLGWLPVIFGSPDFQTTTLSYNLPYVARGIMTVAMFGLLISTALSLLLLPTRPMSVKWWKYIPMSLQWALFPIIATVLSAFPALDAETRLMLGRDLNFNVMKKTRRDGKHSLI